MREINSNQMVTLPKGVGCHVKARVVTVTGPRGKLEKSFRHLAMDIYMINRKKIMVEKWFGTKKEIAAVRTVCSHIDNMVKGKSNLYHIINYCIWIVGLNYVLHWSLSESMRINFFLPFLTQVLVKRKYI
jgi:ribosomal protein L6P/L9E